MENMDFESFAENNSKAEIDVRYSIMRGKRYRDGMAVKKICLRQMNGSEKQKQ